MNVFKKLFGKWHYDRDDFRRRNNAHERFACYGCDMFWERIGKKEYYIDLARQIKLETQARKDTDKKYKNAMKYLKGRKK